MKRSPKRVTSFFPGKGLKEALLKTNKVPTKKRDSNSTDSITSPVPSVEEEAPVSSQEQQEQQELSSLLTATSDKQLSRIISSSSPQQKRPKKSILKSTSSISTKSGNEYFTASSSSISRDPKLSFTSISVREYPVLIGDNPSVTQGVPLTIGWEPQGDEAVYKIEDFESQHRAEPVSSLQEMKFTEEERAQIAKNLGYSESKINKIAHQVKFSTLTRKKKIIRTLHLDTMKTSFRRGLTTVSDSSRNIFGAKQDDDDSDDDSDGDDRDMAF
mmetsp:Transcript_21458/g.52862  ORF Transcript_21458/g.52862 Transcript_21458/m.52862 type:complete len:272 (+) Transcript_21458:105-920(+)